MFQIFTFVMKTKSFPSAKWKKLIIFRSNDSLENFRSFFFLSSFSLVRTFWKEKSINRREKNANVDLFNKKRFSLFWPQIEFSSDDFFSSTIFARKNSKIYQFFCCVSRTNNFSLHSNETKVVRWRSFIFLLLFCPFFDLPSSLGRYRICSRKKIHRGTQRNNLPVRKTERRRKKTHDDNDINCVERFNWEFINLSDIFIFISFFFIS